MTTRRLVITGPAQSDLSDIRAYTLDRYGSTHADAYDMVLKQALRDLRGDPVRPGSKDRGQELGLDGVRSYHIAHSLARAGGAVKKPRHLVLYFEATETELVILRVLHDARDLQRHLPDMD